VPDVETTKRSELEIPTNVRIVSTSADDSTTVITQAVSPPNITPRIEARPKKLFAWEHYNADPCGKNCGPKDLKRVLEWDCADPLIAKIALGEYQPRDIVPGMQTMHSMFSGRNAVAHRDFPVAFKDGKPIRDVPTVSHVCGGKLVTVFLAECNNFPVLIEPLEDTPPVIQPAPEERAEFPVVYGQVCDCAFRHRSDLPEGPYSIHTGFVYPLSIELKE
jgi:hypothetical protein